MSMNLKYTPEKMDNAEFHRIREWHNTFNAFVNGALARGGFAPSQTFDRRELRRAARKFANSVHGSIRKPKQARAFGDWNY